MIHILAIHGSPRRQGNTSLLLQEAVKGAREAGAHTKILMDRCQSLWVKRYWIDKEPFGKTASKRKGLFISVGATKGKKLFDGVGLTVKYFFDALDTELWRLLTYRGLDSEGDVLKHPEYLEAAHQAGKELHIAIDRVSG